MPNLLPKGIWARAGSAGIGASAEPLEMWASLPATTVPRPVIEVWAAGPNHTPQLVWASTASPVTAVVAAFANPTTVNVTWTPPADLKADSYDIYRQDGSLAGTAVGYATAAFADLLPRPVTGTYKVQAKLGGLTAAQVASNTLNLTGLAQTVDANFNAGTGNVDVTWAAPVWGQPDQYDLYVNFVFVTSIAGTATALSYTSPARGTVQTFSIAAVLSGLTAAGGFPFDNAPIPAAVPTSVNVYRGPHAGGGTGAIEIAFCPPVTGSYNGYQMEYLAPPYTTWVPFAASPIGVSACTAREQAIVPPNTLVYAHVRATSVGGASDWMQGGPINVGG